MKAPDDIPETLIWSRCNRSGKLSSGCVGRTCAVVALREADAADRDDAGVEAETEVANRGARAAIEIKSSLMSRMKRRNARDQELVKLREFSGLELQAIYLRRAGRPCLESLLVVLTRILEGTVEASLGSSWNFDVQVGARASPKKRRCPEEHRLKFLSLNLGFSD